jgi:site-specific DNA-methyltransferase (adenine-specific)
MTDATSLSPFYECDGVRVLHGLAQDVLRSFVSGSVDFVVADPPYLVGFGGRWDGDGVRIAGDDDPSWLVPVYRELWRVLRDDSLCVSFYGWPRADEFLGAWKPLGFRPVSHLVFVKHDWGFGRFTRSQHESAYVLAKGQPPRPVLAPSDVLHWVRTRPSLHPNQKPLGAIEHLLARFTKPGDLVLDPFMGSGTTLVAARRGGRRAIGIELEQRYCTVAVERLKQALLPTRHEE